MTWGRLIGLMAAGTLAAPVAAQVAPDRSLAGATPSVEDGLSLNAIGDVLYDSNVLRSTGTGLASGMHRDDFRYSPELTATYGRSSGLIALAANAVVGRDLYQYHSYLDRNHYLGGGTLTYHAGSSCQLSVNGTYASRQSGLNGISTGPTSPVVPPDEVGTVIDNVQTTAVYGANAGCGSPTGRLTFGGGYSHAALSNAAAIRKFGDSDSDTYSGNIGLGILRPGQLSLTGSYSTISYPNRVTGAVAIGVPAQLLNTGVNSYRIGFAFSRPIGPRLSGTIGASFLRAEPTGGQAAYTSPAYNFALGYVAGPRLSFALTGSRDVLPSTTVGALYRVVDQVLVSTRYSLGSSLSIDADAGLIKNDYHQGFAVPGEPTRINDTSTTFRVGVTYAPRPLYDVTLNVSQTIRRSDPSLYNYDSTKVGVTLAVHI